MDPSENKGEIIEADKKLMLYITGASKKEKVIDQSVLPTTKTRLEASLLSNLSHLDPPQKLLLRKKNSEKVFLTTVYSR